MVSKSAECLNFLGKTFILDWRIFRECFVSKNDNIKKYLLENKINANPFIIEIIFMQLFLLAPNSLRKLSFIQDSFILYKIS
jgi:hypothetical protein